MAACNSVKTRRQKSRLVGVITKMSELRVAAGMPVPPDLFEIRLDYFVNHADELEAGISILSRPLIITARHPREGGANHLPNKQRRELLKRFLPHARYIDVEMRSIAAMKPILQLARNRKIFRIISFHGLNSMPSVRSLHTKARTAKRSGAAIFKVAARTDTPAQLARLLDFAANPNVDLGVSAMGIGRLGATSRLALAGKSALVYVAIGRPKIAGQLSIGQFRSRLARAT